MFKESIMKEAILKKAESIVIPELLCTMFEKNIALNSNKYENCIKEIIGIIQSE